MEKIKVGLLMASFNIPVWEYRIVEDILNSEVASLECIFLCDSNTKDDVAPGFLFKLLNTYDSKKYRLKPDALKTIDCEAQLKSIAKITSNSSAKPLVDAILCIDYALATNKLIKQAKFGVWAIRNTMQPVGWWESLKKYPVVHSAVWMLDQDVSHGRVIYESYSGVNAFSTGLTRNKILWKCSSFFSRLLNQFHKNGPTFLKKAQTYPQQSLDLSQSSPSNLAILGPLISHLLFLIRSKWSKTFYFEQWTLLFQFSKDPQFDFRQYRKILPPKQDFWADPFLINENGKHYVFFEDALKRSSKGAISYLQIDEDGTWHPPKKIIDKAYHLSYPFLMKWEGAYYLIPESSQNRTIEVYKCTDFPHQWEFHGNLMEDIIAYDSTLFFHNSKWWLFANIKEHPGSSSWDELHLFYSQSPFSSQWHPHPMNPILSDVRSARPAGGIFVEDGKLFRPSQNSSFRYGYGLNLNQIVTLTEEEYQEIEVESFGPWNKKVKGIHTYNRSGKLTVIDAVVKRFRFF